MKNIGSAMNGAGPKANRKKDDFYATPPASVDPVLPLLEACGFPKDVWEFCCGEGHMSIALQRAGYNVVSTDLVYRGYGEGGRDFREELRPLAPAGVTNPPFDLMDEIIDHAMRILRMEYLALVMPAGAFHSAKRVKAFEEYPPAINCPWTWRLDSTGGGNPTMNVQWVIWSPTIPDWIRCRYYPLLTDVKKAGSPVDIFDLL